MSVESGLDGQDTTRRSIGFSVSVLQHLMKWGDDALDGLAFHSPRLAVLARALKRNRATDSDVQQLVEMLDHKDTAACQFTREVIIPVCVNYDKPYELPSGLAADEGIDRLEHVQVLPKGTHIVPLQVVHFSGVQDSDRQRVELDRIGWRFAVAEEFGEFEKATQKLPLVLPISAEGTSFAHPHRGRFVLSILEDANPRRIFAAWEELRKGPNWRRLIAPQSTLVAQSVSQAA